jgi:hypothetical protein
MLPPFWQTVSDLHSQRDLLRRRRFGVIEMQAGRFSRIALRPLPKLVSDWESRWMGARYHRRAVGDRCWLYYNQPLGHSNFLAIKYMISARDCTFATARAAMTVLEEIARLKGSDAALCDVSNQRISARLLAREGWEQHCLASPRRHFIKRYYGDYPEPEMAAHALALDAALVTNNQARL